MSKPLKSSASSPRAALKSTNSGVTKAEKIVRYRTDPAIDRQLAKDREERLSALENLPEETNSSDTSEPQASFWGRGIRPNMYPPVPIDARVVEWFMKQAGNRTALMFDINRVLQDYVKSEDRKAAKKAG